MKKPISDQIQEKKKVPSVGLEPTKVLEVQRFDLEVQNSRPRFEFLRRLEQQSSWFLKHLDFKIKCFFFHKLTIKVNGFCFVFKKQLQQKLTNVRPCYLFAKGKLAVTNKQLLRSRQIIFDALYFTIRAADGVPKVKFTKLCTFGFGFCLFFFK